MLKSLAGYEWADVIATPDVVLKDLDRNKIADALTRRLKGEPLSRILGVREFWGLDFHLSPATLDPRPDTETLVRAVLEKFKGKPPPERILDFGTGTGCILISLLNDWKRQGQTWGLGVDKSPDAIMTARKNAEEHDVGKQASFVCSDWGVVLSAELDLEQKFDLIVSNPPYIREDDITNLSSEVIDFDPILALSGGKSGLECYELLFMQMKNFLKPQGCAFFEIGYDQHEEIVRLARKYESRVSEVYSDSAGILRVVEISCGDK